MNDLEESFIKLLGRQPTDTERQQLYQVRDALGLKNNDALWLVLMALQYHHSMYARFPELIQQAANATLLQFQQTADTVLAATTQSAKADLAKAVSAAARDVARLTAARQTASWIAVCLLACCLAIGALSFYIQRDAYAAGYDRGYGQAYSEAKDEKAAAAWANTPQGKAAYRLAQYGAIDNLISCNQPGWKAEKGICYVHPTSEQLIYGWKISR